jgi:hypothetical protein
MEEEWRAVVDYEGLYEVSNLGEVRSLRNNNKILKKRLAKVGYYRVGLANSGTVKWFTIHRLVATAFIPNPNQYPCVNHKDEIKTNNRVSNLEWCTYKYNLNYGHVREKIKKNRDCSSFSKPVKQIKNGVVINTFPSIAEATRTLGLGRCAVGNISRTCKKTKHFNTAYGYKWEYI